MITIDLTKEKEGVNINFTGNVIYTKDVGGDKNYATKEYVEEEIKKIEIPNTNNLETKNEAQNKLKEAKSYTDNEIKKVVGNAPESLNTLNKLASATNTNKESIKSLDSAVRNKVDKIDGKGLSTEDFTTVLKQKLESLENFDSSEIEKSVSQLQKQINTLVSGNASTAIESFNEIIAFLEGIEDSEDLSSIIASIEQSIAKKADASSLSKVATSGDYNDLENLPTIPDVSGLASKEEVGEALSSAKSYTDEKVNGIKIPTSLSELSDDKTHRLVTDEEKQSWNSKSDFSGSYKDLKDKPTIPSVEGLASETYVDEKVSTIKVPKALSELSQDASHRLVTDTEKATWSAKSNFSGDYNDLKNKPNIPSLGGYATELWVSQEIGKIEIPSLDGYATEQYVQQQIGNINDVLVSIING